MIPLAFDYEVAESVDHAIELLGQHGDEAKLLAGGHSLLPHHEAQARRPDGPHRPRPHRRPELRQRRGRPPRHRRDDPPHRHGAQLHSCRSTAASSPTRPSLVGDPQVRHRGTIGGSISHGDAASDLPIVATRPRRRTSSSRDPTASGRSAAGDFFQDYLQTDPRARRGAHGDQGAQARPERRLVLQEVQPPRAGLGRGRRRRRRGAVQRLHRFGPHRAHQHGLDALEGDAPQRTRSPARTRPRCAEAASAADEGTSPTSDIAASAEYRRHLARVLTRRAVEEALGR